MNSNFRTIYIKVAGVTYEGRQAHLARLRGDEPCRIIPEPENAFDPNALAVHVVIEGEIKHVGYVPRDLAAEIAPLLEGESLMVKIAEIRGGGQLLIWPAAARRCSE
jgi:hypothetical protein